MHQWWGAGEKNPTARHPLDSLPIWFFIPSKSCFFIADREIRFEMISAKLLPSKVYIEKNSWEQFKMNGIY